MSELTIRTNNHRRDILYSWELTDAERAEFDYIDFDSEDCDSTFFRYKGQAYDLGEFMAIGNHPDKEFSSWDGYSSDSFFSGILVKHPREEWGDLDTDHVIVGRYYC